MGPKRRSSENADEQIIKQGCLIKSPPASSFIFGNRASWKGRLLKLYKTGVGNYILDYYAYDGVSEEFKGGINLSEVKSIELGTSRMEKIPTITRLFNNSPSNILCIKTDKRDFYLVDESQENIAEWKKCITDAWVKAHQKFTIEGPTSPLANLLKVQEEQEEAIRPRSYPVDFPNTGTAAVEELRQRSHTEPVTGKGNPLTLPGGTQQKEEIFSMRPHCSTLAICCRTPSVKIDKPQQGRRHSSAALPEGEGSRLSDDMTDAAYNSEPESVYDTPRSVLKKMSECQDSAEEQEENSDSDPYEYIYEEMTSIVKELPPKPPRRLPVTTLNRYSKRSQLRKADILKMKFENIESDLESIKVTVCTEHLQKYLGLQEVGECLWVSKWKGPVEIGCLFHHGDLIRSMNEFRTGSKEFFNQLLSNSTSDKVDLMVTRNKKAPVFHLEGCSCDSL